MKTRWSKSRPITTSRADSPGAHDGEPVLHVNLHDSHLVEVEKTMFSETFHEPASMHMHCGMGWALVLLAASCSYKLLLTSYLTKLLKYLPPAATTWYYQILLLNFKYLLLPAIVWRSC